MARAQHSALWVLVPILGVRTDAMVEVIIEHWMPWFLADS